MTEPPLTLERCKRILAVLPDDGTDRRLMRALRKEKGINRLDSVPVRAVAMWQAAKTKKGKLPEPTLARVVTAIVEEAEAGAVFDYVYAAANVGRPGGGMVLMHRLLGATAFELPPGVTDEAEMQGGQ